MRSAC